MDIQSFVVHATNDKIWNLSGLLHFLANNQKKSIRLTINPEAIDLYQLGLYDILNCFVFESVQIFTCNPFESHAKYKINYLKSNKFIIQDGSAGQAFWEWNCKKKFLTLYGRPTAARLGISAYLLENYNTDTHLHFSWGNDVDSLQVFELDKLLNFQKNLIEPVGKLIKKLPCSIWPSTGYDKEGIKDYNYNDPLTSLYQDSFVDLIVEAHVKGNTFFPTEKTFRPMWCQRPFIVFASTNYLAYLRQMGFRTFNDFWNESYDGYEGLERLKRIIDLIDFIAQKSYSELETMFWDMKYSLEHNYQILKQQSYKIQISQI